MAYQKRKILRPVPRNCPFCDGGTQPNVGEVENIRRYVSERGKILSHARTGICSKHQRHLSRVIKHARHLALLPFINKV
ncbi:MAG: 30S ribosomal protein S18 [Patescibacteria group bacterium]